MYSTRTYRAAVALINETKPFYAEDYGFIGGVVSALSEHSVIRPTGNTKEAFVELYNGYYKKVTVQEWVVVPAKLNLFILEFERDVAPLVALYQTLNG